jgi:hypothetical protein
MATGLGRTVAECSEAARSEEALHRDDPWWRMLEGLESVNEGQAGVAVAVVGGGEVGVCVCLSLSMSEDQTRAKQHTSPGQASSQPTL